MKKTILSLLCAMFALASAPAWALDTDTDGTRLVSSASDWRELAALVESNPTVNARMTADVDLGDEQTMIGTRENPFQGTFDGQGHTLTVHLEGTENAIAPFRYVRNATVKNVHVMGSIHTTGMYAGGLVCESLEANGDEKGTTVSQCWVSAYLEVDVTWGSTQNSIGGIFAGPSHNSVIEDCLFDGTVSDKNYLWNGGFVNHSSLVTIRNSLNLGTFPSNASDCGTFNRLDCPIENCYYLNPFGRSQGEQVTEEQLADGTVTTALQAGRTEQVWVQDSESGRPILKVFTQTEQGDEILISSVGDWRRFAAMVESNPTVNARMTADVDLGDEQTMIGTRENPFQGTFDGQGHTLTVHLEGTENGITPFRYVRNATIEKVHVKGSVHTTGMAAGGLVCESLETSGDEKGTTVRQCWVSAYLEVDITWGGLQNSIGSIFLDPKVNSVIEDCVFDGIIADKNNHYCGGFVNHSSLVTIRNSLNLGTFPSNASDCGTFNRLDCPIENCYYLNPFSRPQGEQVTEEQLADGTVTAALQAGRPVQVWVQDETMRRPRLKVFKDGGPDETYDELICWLDGGATVSWRFSEKPKVQLKGGEYTISSTRATVSYKAIDVIQYTLRRVSAVGIDHVLQATPGQPSVNREDGQLTFSGCKAGETVTIYNTAGRQVMRQQAGSDGRLQLPLGSLPAGIYLVKTGSVTLKIATK